MATKIRGITIDIGADTAGLQKSLKDTNGVIGATQKQLTDVERLLKLDPTNTELLAKKQELLAQNAEASAQKVEALRAAQEKLKESGVSQTSDQYIALTSEIVRTEAAAKKLADSMTDVKSSGEKASAALKKIGSAAETVEKKTKGISTAAAGLVAGIAAAGIGAVKTADDLNTLAKQTGFSTAELQKMRYAADLIDVDAETITGAATKLKKAMVSASKDTVAAFETLGVAVRDELTGELRSSTDVFYDVIAALSTVSNETERDTLAMQIFGKSADQLAGIVDDGGAALRELGKQAEDLGLILSQETLDDLNSVNDELDTLKANATATLATTGAKALEALTPVLDRVVEALGRLLEWLGSLDSQTITTIAAIAAVVAAISPVAGMISTITSVVTFLMANPIVAGILAVVAAVGLLIVAIKEIVEHWDTIKQAWGELVARLKTVVSQIYDETIKPLLDKIVNAFSVAWNAIKDGFSRLVGGLKSIAQSILNGILTVIENQINRIIGGINDVLSGFNGVIGWAGRVLGQEWGGIGLIPEVHLPRMATGGILSSGSALVGEAGPEILTVAGGRAIVQPLTATVDANALAAAMPQGQTNVNVSFTGSLAALATVLQPAIQVESARVGPSLVTRN